METGLKLTEDQAKKARCSAFQDDAEDLPRSINIGEPTQNDHSCFLIKSFWNVLIIWISLFKTIKRYKILENILKNYIVLI